MGVHSYKCVCVCVCVLGTVTGKLSTLWSGSAPTLWMKGTRYLGIRDTPLIPAEKAIGVPRTLNLHKFWLSLPARWGDQGQVSSFIKLYLPRAI